MKEDKSIENLVQDLGTIICTLEDRITRLEVLLRTNKNSEKEGQS